MTEIEDVETLPERKMNAAEEDLAATIYGGIMRSTRLSPRGLQSAEFRVGLSDLGFCSERVRRMIAREEPEDVDMLPAFAGTALGDHMERACLDLWPDAITQAEVSLVLNGDTGQYIVSGHPDLIKPEGVLIDFKTDRGLAVVRRTGPSKQQQFQRHTYAAAAWQSGLFHPDVAMDEVMVANVWMDRAADDRELHVQMEPFNQDWVDQAGQWLDDVVYAFLHAEPARKEPPLEMCRKTCGFFANCRAEDVAVSGLLTDETVLTSIDLYREGLLMEKAGKRLKDQAKQHLVDIQGSTGTHAVRWVSVNGSHIEFDRPSYNRLNITELK